MKSFHCALLLIVMTALVLSGCSMISKSSIGNNQLALNENTSNGESTQPQGESNQPANDPLQYVQATSPSPYYQWIEGNPVGTWAEWEQSTNAGSSTTYWAIVGTEGDSDFEQPAPPAPATKARVAAKNRSQVSTRIFTALLPCRRQRPPSTEPVRTGNPYNSLFRAPTGLESPPSGPHDLARTNPRPGPFIG